MPRVMVYQPKHTVIGPWFDQVCNGSAWLATLHIATAGNIVYAHSRMWQDGSINITDAYNEDRASMEDTNFACLARAKVKGYYNLKC